MKTYFPLKYISSCIIQFSKAKENSKGSVSSRRSNTCAAQTHFELEVTRVGKFSIYTKRNLSLAQVIIFDNFRKCLFPSTDNLQDTFITLGPFFNTFPLQLRIMAKIYLYLYK